MLRGLASEPWLFIVIPTVPDNDKVPLSLIAAFVVTPSLVL